MTKIYSPSVFMTLNRKFINPSSRTDEEYLKLCELKKLCFRLILIFLYSGFMFVNSITACGTHSENNLKKEKIQQPFRLSSIPEATSGFQYPLDNPFSNNGGWMFGQYAGYPDPASPNYYVYHPGEDWNRPGVSGGCGNGCNSDRCLPVRASANGRVVYSNDNSWGGIVVQHNYQEQTWYTQYGHIINSNVSVGDEVSKGQQIAEIGNVGTGCAHLHFEVRESDHPDPTYGGYWQYQGNGINILSNVNDWYESPNIFIPNHPAYTTTCNPPTNSNQYVTNVTQTTARVYCNASGIKRDLRVRPSGNATWMNYSAFSNTYRNISGLSAETNYQYQTAVKCSSGQWSNWGPIESFTTSSAICNTPTNSQQFVRNVTQTTARIYCNASGIKRDLRIKSSGSSTWMNYSAFSNTYRNISGLSAGTTYQYQTAVKCSNGQWSNWGPIESFVTLSASCNAPTGVNSYATSCTSATLYWNAVSGVSYYNLLYWNGSNWVSFGTTTNTSIQLNVNPNSTYYLAVESVCGNSYSNINSHTTLITGSCKNMMPNNSINGVDVESSSSPPPMYTSSVNSNLLNFSNENSKTNMDENLLKVSPNPILVGQNINLLITGINLNKIQISDINGKMIRKIPVNQNLDNLTINSNNFVPGIYFVSLISNQGEVVSAKKLLIN